MLLVILSRPLKLVKQKRRKKNISFLLHWGLSQGGVRVCASSIHLKILVSISKWKSHFIQIVMIINDFFKTRYSMISIGRWYHIYIAVPQSEYISVHRSVVYVPYSRSENYFKFSSKLYFIIANTPFHHKWYILIVWDLNMPLVFEAKVRFWNHSFQHSWCRICDITFIGLSFSNKLILSLNIFSVRGFIQVLLMLTES